MFAGHVGAALALGRAERRLNVGVLITAALLPDVVLWLCVLAGWESVGIPADFARTHQPEFVFPYSHSLSAGVLWSALAGAAGLLAYAQLSRAKWRAAALIGAAVFSHWLLDALVHRAELPLAGAASPTIGFGLWNAMPIALAIAAAIVVGGLCLFMRGSSLSRTRSVALAVMSLLLLAFTIVGMTIAPPPPSAIAMAASSLVTLVLVCALACWLGRLPRGRI